MIKDTATHACQYCKSKFSKEKTLFVHVCEQKRRALARTERHVVLAYETFTKWYKVNMNSAKDQSYEDFAKSPYYNGFVKFGSFVSNVNPLYPLKFIEYVITSGVKLDHWCREELYDQYVINLIKVESVDTALERGVTHMEGWGKANDADWAHYFKYVSINRACYDIRDGKISPWLVLNSNNGKIMLRKFDDLQLSAIGAVMDIPFWMDKFKKRPADVAVVRQVITELGL